MDLILNNIFDNKILFKNIFALSVFFLYKF